jgi:hypothetical protein
MAEQIRYAVLQRFNGKWQHVGSLLAPDDRISAREELRKFLWLHGIQNLTPERMRRYTLRKMPSESE